MLGFLRIFPLPHEWWPPQKTKTIRLDMSTRTHLKRTPPVSHAVTPLVLEATFLVTLNALLLVMTVLRESELFWRNKGGYPIPFRAFVLNYYAPLFLLMALANVLFSVLGFQRVRKLGLLLVIFFVFASGIWFLFGSTVAIMVANNVINLLENRPMHWH
ncbi:MAG TPA: hypothetical protein DEW46_03580 [Verrucomicrobia bacterium]|jgi:hypothetical protein|nr:hypothetical protein [Verrucomicrobiota bacterium]